MDEAQTADSNTDLTGAVLAKTDLGREEIRTRALRLPPFQRRLLLLADGQRDMHALAELFPGQDTGAAARELLGLGCLVIQARRAPPAPAPAPAAPPAAAPANAQAAEAAAATSAALAALPPAGSRTPQQVEMARNFMINTINTLLEQYSHLTLVKQIAESQGAEGLRVHLAAWDAAIATSWVGKKRLPELRKKLFAVL
jgi:hypothetical protein